MSVFVIKIIACITMVLDHVKYALPVTQNLLTIILGRVAFPLFAFLITEGFIHTSNLKSYMKRLFIFGLISQIPFMLFRTLVGEWKMLNIMFTLLLGLLAILAYSKIEKKYLSIPLCILIIALGEILNVDYGWFGVALVLIIYIFKDHKILFPIIYITLVSTYLALIGVNLTAYLLYMIGYIIPLVIMMLYNGKLGKKIKYFFYCFYPAHMLILYGIYYFLR